MRSPAPYGAFPPPPPPPGRKSSSKTLVIVLCSVLGASLLLCGGCGAVILIAGNTNNHQSATNGVATGPAQTGSAAAVPETTTASPAPSPTGRTVVFAVTADSGQASVTYGVNFNQQQDTEATLPWSQTVKVDPGDAVNEISIWAQNTGGGTINCSITLD